MWIILEQRPTLCFSRSIFILLICCCQYHEPISLSVKLDLMLIKHFIFFLTSRVFVFGNFLIGLLLLCCHAFDIRLQMSGRVE